MWGFIAFFDCLRKLINYFCAVTRFFPLGSPYLKVPTVVLNSGGQLLSCSIVVLPFSHLPKLHPRSSAWGPDEASSPCPALIIVVCKLLCPLCSWEHVFLLCLASFVWLMFLFLNDCYFLFCLTTSGKNQLCPDKLTALIVPIGLNRNSNSITLTVFSHGKTGCDVYILCNIQVVLSHVQLRNFYPLSNSITFPPTSSHSSPSLSLSFFFSPFPHPHLPPLHHLIYSFWNPIAQEGMKHKIREQFPHMCKPADGSRVSVRCGDSNSCFTFSTFKYVKEGMSQDEYPDNLSISGRRTIPALFTLCCECPSNDTTDSIF